MREQYQTVIITLSDCSKVFYTGKAQLFSGDTRHVCGVVFTEPKELPEGVHFEQLEEEYENDKATNH